MPGPRLAGILLRQGYVGQAASPHLCWRASAGASLYLGDNRQQSTTINDSGLAKDEDEEKEERRTTNHKSKITQIPLAALASWRCNTSRALRYGPQPNFRTLELPNSRTPLPPYLPRLLQNPCRHTWHGHPARDPSWAGRPCHEGFCKRLNSMFCAKRPLRAQA